MQLHFKTNVSFLVLPAILSFSIVCSKLVLGMKGEGCRQVEVLGGCRCHLKM